MKRLGQLASASTVVALSAAPAVAQGVPGLNQAPDKINLNDVVNVLTYIIKYGLAFAAAIGAIYVVVAGYQYVLSAGNPEKVEKAKMGLTWSVVGFIIAVSAFAVVNTLQLALKQNKNTQVSSFFNPAGPNQIGTTFESITGILFAFAAGTAILFIILGGYRYITSQGNQEMAEKAKNTLLYALIGLGVTMLSAAIFFTVRHVICTNC